MHARDARCNDAVPPVTVRSLLRRGASGAAGTVSAKARTRPAVAWWLSVGPDRPEDAYLFVVHRDHAQVLEDVEAGDVCGGVEAVGAGALKS